MLEELNFCNLKLVDSCEKTSEGSVFRNVPPTLLNTTADYLA